MGKKQDGKLQWWAGTDEERMSAGPFARKEDAIAEGKSDFDGEAFTIMQAAHAIPSIPDADRFIQVFLEDNEEMGDPEGDSYGADFKATPDQEEELTAELERVFTAWMDKHELWPEVFMFGRIADRDDIEAETPDEE